MIQQAFTRIRDGAISRISALGDRRDVATLARVGIEYEQLLRAYREATPQLVRAVWGLASRRDVAALLERLAALEDKVREVEAKVEKR